MGAVVDDTQRRPHFKTAANLELQMKLRTVLITAAMAAMGASAFAQSTMDSSPKPAEPTVKPMPAEKPKVAKAPAHKKHVAKKTAHKKAMPAAPKPAA